MANNKLLISVAGQGDKFLPNQKNFGWPSPVFYKELELRGYDMTELLSGDFLLCINHDPVAYRNFIQRGNPHKNSILIRTEPKSVYPAQYTNKIENLYGLILSTGLIQENFNATNFIYHPYTFQVMHGGPSFSDPSLELLFNESEFRFKFNSKSWEFREKKIVMLASNKFSPVKNSGYSIRRKIAKIYKDSELLEIYGMYWKSPFFFKLYLFLAMVKFNINSGFLPALNLNQIKKIKSTSIKDRITNKLELLNNSQFLIIVENSPDSLTEKIFDAFFCGVIPIYCGADLTKVGIPNSTYIKLNWNLSNLEEIIDSLYTLDVQSYLTSIFNFIRSDQFWLVWTEKAAYSKIVDKIDLYCNSI